MQHRGIAALKGLWNLSGLIVGFLASRRSAKASETRKQVNREKQLHRKR
jgi:hypothetical protein